MLDDLGLPERLQAVAMGAPLEYKVPVSPKQISEISRAGFQFFQQGEWEKSRNVFKALTELAPDNYNGYAGLGALLLREQKLKEAMEKLVKAVELNCNDPAVCANLGEVLLRMGKLKEASVLLSCAIELDPSKRHPSANRARAMLAAIEDMDAKGNTDSE